MAGSASGSLSSHECRPPSTITLREYSEAWLRGRANLAPRTREIYAAQLRVYVLPKIDPEIPALGEVAIADLTPELIRSWYGALKRRCPTATGRSSGLPGSAGCAKGSCSPCGGGTWTPPPSPSGGNDCVWHRAM